MMDLPLLILVVSEAGAEYDLGPMRNSPEQFRVLEVGKIKEALAKL